MARVSEQLFKIKPFASSPAQFSHDTIGCYAPQLVWVPGPQVLTYCRVKVFGNSPKNHLSLCTIRDEFDFHN
jgi:hypothetical protein